MTGFSVLAANYALFAVAAGAALVWLFAPRESKVSFAIEGILAAGLVGVLVKIAGALWTDPRPFVIDHVTPLIHHSADNGFPSDHTTLAAAVAFVVLAHHRVAGWTLLGVSVVLGWARVMTLVHHWPDVIGGVALGAAAAGLAYFVVHRAWPWLTSRSSGRHAAVATPY